MPARPPAHDALTAAWVDYLTAGGLLAALEAVEWSGKRQPQDGCYEWDDCCPCCGAVERPGEWGEADQYNPGEHWPGCQLAAALRKARGEATA
jgi:hypothetical protein